MIRAPWVVAKDDGVCVCTRCGEQLKIQLPCLIPVWTAAARAFVKAHSRCEEKTT